MRALSPVLLSLLVASASAGNFFQQLAGSDGLETADTPVPGESPLQLCDGNRDDDVLTIEHVDLAPNPPVPGQTLSIKASGVTHDVIEKGAYCELTVKYGLITLIRETIDLCDNVKEVDLECPIDKGNMTLKKDVDLPSAIPPGKYNVIAKAYTADDRPITCLSATVQFGGSHSGL